MNVKNFTNKINNEKSVLNPASKKQDMCNHDWSEVRVWSFGATYIKYCLKCGAKETSTKA